jgi:DNA-binding PadR family transcriptional regulator
MPRPLGLTSLRILAAVRDGDAYGLDLVARTGLPSGTVYPTLARLKRSGLVVAHWEDQRVAERDGRPRRRYYELSVEGARALVAGAARVTQAAAELRAAPGHRAG